MKNLLITLALLGLGALGAMTTEVGSIRGFLYGVESRCGYDNWVSHVSEKTPVTYNRYAPWDVQTTGFGSYRYPSEEDLIQWEQVMRAWLSEDIATVDSLIALYELPYETVFFQDLDVGRQYYMLRELLNDDIDYNGSAQAAIIEEGSFDYGWGLYIFNPDASRPMIVTAVHPCDDYPSPIIALEAMLKWDARFLFIAGAGREVLMTGMVNDSSLSDPSRHETHVFNVAYQLACQQIRNLTGKIEFSVQMHTFDWQTHPYLKPVSVSAGQGRNYPSLPIVDESRLRNDLFHHTPWEVLAENAFGTHPAITIENYYVVNSLVPIACEASGHPAVISASRELPGSSTNQQMLYTEQANIYDSYSPFFHVEMAELPIFLPQNNLSWQKFYGWDPTEERWKMSMRWVKFIECYSPWLDAMENTLDDLIRMDDYNDPSNPENFCVTSVNRDRALLAWDRSYDYDFESYEIKIRHIQDGEEISEIRSRNDADELARQTTTSYRINFADYDSPLQVSLRARDKNNRATAWSEELFLFAPDPNLGAFSNVTVIPEESSISLSFNASFQNSQSYKITRSVDGGPFTPLTTLPISPVGSYQYIDQNLLSSSFYRYRIGVALSSGAEYWHHEVLGAQPLKVITISIYDTQNNLQDQIRIGNNHFALDDLDEFDITKSLPNASEDYVWLASTHPNPRNYFSLELKSPFDDQNKHKEWILQARSSYANSNLIIHSNINQTDIAGDLLLWDEDQETWHDLRSTGYSWNIGSSGISNFKLLWGDIKPEIRFENLPRQVLPAGSVVQLNWQVINPARFQSLELWMKGNRDSLLIDPLLSAYQESYMWSTPATGLAGYRILVKGIDLEGQTLSFISPYVYDFFPNSITIDVPAGISTFSIANTSWTADVAYDFMPGTNVWKVSNIDGWLSMQFLRPLNAYIIDSPLPTQITAPPHNLAQNFSMALEPEWNFVPNAHYHSYDLSQIQLVLAGQSYSYAQLSEMKLVSRLPYSFTEKGWQFVHELKPNSTLMFYYFGSQDCTLLLDPQVLPTEYEIKENSWELELSISSANRGRDSFVIGSSDEGSEEVNPFIDALKPTLITNQTLQMCITGPNYELLQSKFKGWYADYSSGSKTWNFRIIKTMGGIVELEADVGKLPEDFTAQITLASQHFTLNSSEPIYVNLPAGTHYGSITVSKIYNSLDTHESAAFIAAYPNPFKDAVCFNWKEQSKNISPKAVVYNIKGQKVRSLNVDDQGSGRFSSIWDGRDEQNRSTAKGIYLLKINTSQGQVIKKIIKK